MMLIGSAQAQTSFPGGFFPVLTDTETGKRYRPVILDGQPNDQQFLYEHIAEKLAHQLAGHNNKHGRFIRPVVELTA